jgi:hypothetical protein
MVQNLILAVAVGLVEGVWLYFSLARQDRPRFALLTRQVDATAEVLGALSYPISEQQAA